MPTTPTPRRSLRVATPLVIVLLVAVLSAAGLSAGFAPDGSASANEPGKSSPDLARGSRIPWRDGSYFLSGVNYPFYGYYGGDVATLSSVDSDCTWAYSTAFDYAALDADFARMRAGGVHVIRWFLFGDGRGAPEFDFNRRVTGFDAGFYNHMDQVMEIAARHNIYIIWTLWDFLAFMQANWLCGGAGLADAYAAAATLPPAARQAFLSQVERALAAPRGWLPGSAPDGGQQCMIFAGGHRNLVTDTAPGGAQDTFFNNALIPMLQRYASNPFIVGWEIMNEPEWALNINPYTGQNPTVTEPVDVEQMRAFFARFAQAVHTYAPAQYATVGGASLKFMGFGQFLQPGIWSGLGFDYYGAHYYGWMESTFNNGSPMTIDYNTTQQQLDAPVVIGELPANGGTAPIYLPSVRRSGGETTMLSLRYICTAYAPGGDPPCTRSYSATIEYLNPNGTVASTQAVTIPPYGGWSGPVPPGSGDFSGAARIVSNGPLAAAVTQAGILSAAEQVTYTGHDQGSLTTWLPLVTNQGTHRTRIAVQNTSVHAASGTITYYNQAGTAVATTPLSLTPRGSTLVDPLLPGSPPGPPPGFQGSAVVAGSLHLVATAYELDPQLGSDTYNGEGQGYQHSVNLPLVRNFGANGSPTLYVQNPCCAAAQVTVAYYNPGGTQVASQVVNLPLYGSAVVDPQSVLPGGFEGTAVITSDQFPAAVIRSVTTNGSVSTTSLYAATQNPDQRLHFPVVHRPDAGGSGRLTTFAGQNVSQSSPINIWVTLNDHNGGQPYFSNSITIPPRGQWVASTASLPGVPPGFNGTAEVLWPWPSGWNQGFPLLATALDLDGALTSGSAYRGVASHSQYWAVTPYTPGQLMEGTYARNWAGALAWSYYDQGTGTWDDFRDASAAFDAAHPADVRIGQAVHTPIPTLAATNTPAYGNGQTATAVAQQTGTPQPPCTNCAFTDVPPGSTFYPFVTCLACRDIVSGYSDGTFRPGNNVTRGQLSKIVSNSAAFNDAIPATQQTFADVPNSNAFWLWIERMVAHDVINGYQCGGAGEPCDPQNRPYFRWGANATRGQIGKIVSEAKEFNDAIPPAQQTFADVPGTNPFWLWIERLNLHGVISGYACGGAGEPCDPQNRPYFRWGANATRGQTSKIVANTFFPNCETP